jgi:hypothetical protein
MIRFRDRSTGELLVLMIAGTVCGTVIVQTVLVITWTFIRPEVDTTNITRQISAIINTLVGLLAGFLAGRTETAAQNRQMDSNADKIDALRLELETAQREREQARREREDLRAQVNRQPGP